MQSARDIPPLLPFYTMFVTEKAKHLLPSATKFRRLCFYRHLSVHSGGGSTWPGAPPRSRHPPDQVHPRDQVHPTRADPPRTRYTPGPGTAPWTRYTPSEPGTPPNQVHPPDQVHPPGPGTHPPGADTPRDQVHPLDQVHPPDQVLPPRDQVHHPPLPRYSHCCGQYASHWNAFLFYTFIYTKIQNFHISIHQIVVLKAWIFFQMYFTS